MPGQARHDVVFISSFRRMPESSGKLSRRDTFMMTVRDSSTRKLPRNKEHCMKRFAVRPQPKKNVDLWGFDEATLVSSTSRILFVNGLNDGWSVGGILQDLSKERLGLGKLEWWIVDLHKSRCQRAPKTCRCLQFLTRTNLRPRHFSQLQNTSDGGRDQHLDAEFFVDLTHW